MRVSFAASPTAGRTSTTGGCTRRPSTRFQRTCADIDGLPIYYLRFDAERTDALPIVLTHG